MWKCLSLCIVLTLCRDAGGAFSNLMAQVTQECCDSGSAHARTHTGEGCNIPQAPADVSEQFGHLCVIAQAECCNDYFKKTENCAQGIDLALTSEECGKKKDMAYTCCDGCKRGTAAGLDRGVEACVLDTKSTNAEDLLTDDAFVKCCQKAVKEGAPKLTSKPKFIPSLCEEYAPNELCAHHCIAVPGSFRCECDEGFMLMADKRSCKKIETNRCKKNNPCQHKCVDTGKELTCSCKRGYELKADKRSCQDIDECKLNIHLCLPGTTCQNALGTYHCIHSKPKVQETAKGECPPGFARNLRNNACDDINECKLPRPPCPAPHCSNTVGGYKCDGRPGDPVDLAAARASDDRCPPGLAVDRTGACEAANSTPVMKPTFPPIPLPFPPISSVQYHQFKPKNVDEEDRCPPGFRMSQRNRGICDDVDECAILKDDCNRLSQFCVNTHGSFFCQNMASKNCQPGFKIDPVTGRCEDINECIEDPEVCTPKQICINQLGQYNCKTKPGSGSASRGGNCPDGMRFNPNTQVCDDVDECVEGTHLCDQHQRCLNTNGSFECYCRLGFEQDHTTGACVDVNECATQRHDCVQNSQRCDNTVGSFLCIRITSCGTGYILQHSTGDCEDVDECALGTHNCPLPNYECTNIPGSFRCMKKKTTTTTPEPEYDYYYYDDEDNTTNANNTNTENTPLEVPTTSSAPASTPIISSTPPSSTTEAVTVTELITTPKATSIEIPVENSSNQENIIPTSPDKDEDTTETERKPIDYIPEVPRYVAPLYPETTPTPSEPKFDNKPDIIYEPNEPTTQKENTDNTYYETRPEKPVSSNEIPEETKPTERVPDIESRLPDEPRSTYSPFRPTPKPVQPVGPQTVLVHVGEETATVDGIKRDDGSVVIDTKDVPKNEWTGVNIKPADCPPGFEASDTGGCFDIDECSSNRHSCSGITEVCHNTNGGYLCDCAVGFRRHLTTGVCALIVTTTSTTTTARAPIFPTTVKATTKDYFYGFHNQKPIMTRPFVAHSACNVGFNLNARTGECEDLDECSNGQANCAAVEICVNTRGGYKCECPPNWWLDEDRHRCVPLRDRDRFPHGYRNVPVSPSDETRNQTKHVDPLLTPVVDREPVLKCPLGYRLGYDNTCVDVDECATGEAQCGHSQICTNQDGGYTCSCPRGHKLVGDHLCEDVDECALAGNQSICSRNAHCVNTVGSYRCQCHAGFRTAAVNDKVCLDIDECAESRAGTLCQHRCLNQWGGYRCACHKGYRLAANNKTCVDINECQQKLTCVGKCVNELGSYRCDCPIGYRLSEDKKSCIDIDECETNEATCQAGISGGTSHVCFNTRGSYRCHRITCPPGYELENKHRCTKSEKICGPGDAACAHQPTTISYNFITFVSNLYVPSDSVKLFTMRGPAWPFTKLAFQLRLVAVDAPPNVKERADTNTFILTDNGHEGVIALVHPLQGPQTIELELSMELYSKDQFGGTALAKIIIYVSEYEY